MAKSIKKSLADELAAAAKERRDAEEQADADLRRKIEAAVTGLNRNVKIADGEWRPIWRSLAGLAYFRSETWGGDPEKQERANATEAKARDNIEWLVGVARCKTKSLVLGELRADVESLDGHIKGVLERFCKPGISEKLATAATESSLRAKRPAFLGPQDMDLRLRGWPELKDLLEWFSDLAKATKEAATNRNDARETNKRGAGRNPDVSNERNELVQSLVWYWCHDLGERSESPQAFVEDVLAAAGRESSDPSTKKSTKQLIDKTREKIIGISGKKP